jgi:transcription-repair coupling factor (superfamily II helicase)
MVVKGAQIEDIERLKLLLSNPGNRVISLDSLTSTSAKAFVLSQLKLSGQTVVVVTDTNQSAETWETDLIFWAGKEGASVLTLPSFDTDVYSGSSPHAETMERRAFALWQMARMQPSFVIMSARSLISRTVAPDEITSLGATLKVDGDHSPDDLVEKLAASGYVREDPIGNFGQFSVRGGILDVWSPDAPSPVRIEFFGDTVDSIRVFDPDTQLSTERLKATSIAPMREFSASDKDFKDWAFFANEAFAHEALTRSLRDRTDFAVEGESFSGWEFLLPLVKPLNSTVFDYLDNAIFVIDEPVIVEQTLESLAEFVLVERVDRESDIGGDLWH